MSSEKAKVSEQTPPESVMEKGEVVVKDGRASYSSGIEKLAGPTFDDARTTRLLRKMDWNIVPFLALLYLYVIFIHRLLSPILVNDDACF